MTAKPNSAQRGEIASPAGARPRTSGAKKVGDVVEEFLSMLRSGDEPSIDACVADNPKLADDLRRVLPTLLLLEGEKSQTAQHDRAVAQPVPRQLGDFRIVREIGRGGMGVVYEAVQESLGRRVALKLLAPQALLDPKYVRRFQREARAAAQLHHTNIVPVFGFGEEQGRHYYVMQIVDSRGLDAVIRDLRSGQASIPRISDDEQAVAVDDATTDGGPRSTGTGGSTVDHCRADTSRVLSRVATPSVESAENGTPTLGVSLGSSHHWRNVARIGSEIADALAYAHAHGTLHRDIKPSNLLIDANGAAWISDFGLAKGVDEDDLTATGEVLGTLRYAPPEALRGEYGARSDVFSLGLTLHELCALRPARDAERREHLLRQASQDAPPRLERIASDVPRDLRTIVHKAIEVDPARRYQRAVDLADDLRRFLADRPIRARRVGWPERAWRWCRRNPAISATSLAAVAIVAVTVVVAFLNVNASRHRAVQAFENEQVERRNANRSAVEAKENLVLAQQTGEALKKALVAAQTQREIADAKTAQTRESLTFARRTVARYLTLLGDSPELKAEGLETLRYSLLNNAREFYDHLVDMDGDDADIRSDRANGYLRLGQLLHDIGRVDEGNELILQAETIFEKLHHDAPDVWRNVDRLCGCLESSARVLQKLTKIDESNAKQERSIELIKSFVERHPDDLTAVARLAKAYELLGVAYSRRVRDGRSIAAYEKSLDLYRGLLRRDPSAFETRREMAETLSNLGLSYRRARRFAESTQALDEAMSILGTLREERPDHIRAASNLALATGYSASLYRAIGQRDRAIATYQLAVERFADLATRREEIVMYQEYLAANLANLGEMLADAQRMREADDAFARAIDIRERQLRQSALPWYRGQLVKALRGRAMVQVKAASADEALALIDRGTAVANEFDELQRRQFLAPLHDGMNHFYRGLALRRLGRYGEAALELSRGYAEAEQRLASKPKDATAAKLKIRARLYLDAMSKNPPSGETEMPRIRQSQPPRAPEP